VGARTTDADLAKRAPPTKVVAEVIGIIG